MASVQRWCQAAFAATTLVLGPRPADGCNIPVFRYALEFWSADMYRLLVFHRGPFSERQQADIEKLKAVEASRDGHPPLSVIPLDVTGEILEEFASIWDTERQTDLPRAVLLYPAALTPDQAAWAGSLHDAASVVVELSPLREDLARRLVDGHTAVWLFVESGDADKDTQAEAELSGTLEKMQGELRLPQEIEPADAEYATTVREGVDLRIEFSVIRLALDDPGEVLLVSTLRGLAGDELPAILPAAIPVYGRGRALGVMAHDQITRDTVAEVCHFLVGPCSCQVKAQNPGFDILLPIDWDGALAGRLVVREDPPALVGLPSSEGPAASEEGETPANEARREDPGNTASCRPLRSLAIVLMLGLAVVLSGTVSLWWRRQARRSRR